MAAHARLASDLVTYAVERYWPGVTEAALADAARSARRAATAMRAEGRRIRIVDTFVVRDEEMVMTVFEAGSAAEAQEAVERAGLPFDRITRLDRARTAGRGDAPDTGG
jgi:Nickel responsive protein SCO4226-like